MTTEAFAPTYADARLVVAEALARAMAPRKPLTVSQWADLHYKVSTKQGAVSGQWKTSNNPPLQDPMDCMSALSPVHDVALKFPIQFGKSAIGTIVLGYRMEHKPGPMMYVLPGEVSMNKWTEQKLNPMLDETEAVKALLSSTKSRDGANRKEFKDFAGGQLYIEHAGNAPRLKSTTAEVVIVDELDEMALALRSGDDPDKMIDGRTSAYPGTYKRLRISTPTIEGLSRIQAAFDKGDQRYYHVPCPHCGEEQHLEWSGLHWGPGGTDVYYACRECGARIDEHHKTEMIRRGRWVPHNEGAKTRSYTINCLYYQFGLGPRWATLVEEWLEAQGDPAKLKTFVNDRLAETWEDAAMRSVRHQTVQDRAEPYPLRIAPEGVLAVTAGLDTQDDREAVHIIGWGEGMRFWVLDYVELPGDPADEEVWHAVTELLQRPIQHALGGTLRVEAACIDAGGHRTEHVKSYVSTRPIPRCMAIFGATQNNAPILGKAKYEEAKARNRTDRKGRAHHMVGTVAAKHWLYSRIAADARNEPEDRLCHFSDELDDAYFRGVVGETFDPRKKRFVARRGARVEPLDTWGYAFAAAHHPELRLHKLTATDWAGRRERLSVAAGSAALSAKAAPVVVPAAVMQQARSPVAKSDWSSRL
jgi:phage terminase large subunit GpA-like protein